MSNYSVKIKSSSKELSTKERIRAKDLSDCVKLDKEISEDGEGIIIYPESYIVLEVHNEKSKNNPDYNNYVINDKDGTRYATGSESFWRAFSDIWDEITDAISDGEVEEWGIKAYKLPSKNYDGKTFITCSII